MGYIYLQPPSEQTTDKYHKKQNDLLTYIADPHLLRIEPLRTVGVVSYLEKMRQSDITYAKALDIGEIDAEYENDMDEHGYLIGIELDLSKDRLLRIIHDDVFRYYKLLWHSKLLQMYTFDEARAVFDHQNVIYPLTDEHDSFVIVQVDEKYRTGMIKAFLTANQDLYPHDYMVRPDFILTE